MKKRAEAARQPVRRRAIPGGRVPRSAEQRLKNLGVTTPTIQYLIGQHGAVEVYLKAAELGEPMGSAEIGDSLKEIARSTTNFLNLLNDQPHEVKQAAFGFGRDGYAADEEFASLVEALERLKQNSETVRANLAQPQRHSHRKFWSRKYLLRVQQLLASDGWTFDHDADLNRLARVVEALNTLLPLKARISKPINLIREILGKATD